MVLEGIRFESTHVRRGSVIRVCFHFGDSIVETALRCSNASLTFSLVRWRVGQSSGSEPGSAIFRCMSNHVSSAAERRLEQVAERRTASSSPW